MEYIRSELVSCGTAWHNMGWAGMHMGQTGVSTGMTSSGLASCGVAQPAVGLGRTMWGRLSR